MVVWVGGLIFFAFVVAPVAFRVLPSKHEAGLVVGRSLGVLNSMGMVCSVLFVWATQDIRNTKKGSLSKLLTAEMRLALLMMCATVYVRTNVPAMERDRIAVGGDIDAAPKDNPARLDFERLHTRSEKVEGLVLLFGLGVVVLMGFEYRMNTCDSAL
jgi:uncharacterized membrane protein